MKIFPNKKFTYISLKCNFSPKSKSIPKTKVIKIGPAKSGDYIR